MKIFLTVIILLGNNHKCQISLSYYQCVFMTNESIRTIRQAIKPSSLHHPSRRHNDASVTSIHSRSVQLCHVRIICMCGSYDETMLFSAENF